MITFWVYLLISIIIIIHLFFKFIVNIKIGRPPIGSLLIAYKYSKLKNSSTNESNIFSSSFNSVRLYYSDKSGDHIDYARGVILSDTCGNFSDSKLLTQAMRNGFSVIRTPEISHALYIVFPIFLSSFLTKIFAIVVGYPKIRQFTEERNLCGYPVLEIYGKRSIILVVPLLRQDDFIVYEASSLVFGNQYYSLSCKFDDMKNYHLSISKNDLPLTSNLGKEIISKLVKRETRG